MSSNSKLTPEQKQTLKTWKAMLPKDASLKALGRMTVLCVPGGNVTHVYSSVASPDEKKIRPKVGEFYVIWRWMFCESTFMLPGLWYVQEVLEAFGFDEV